MKNKFMVILIIILSIISILAVCCIFLIISKERANTKAQEALDYINSLNIEEQETQESLLRPTGEFEQTLPELGVLNDEGVNIIAVRDDNNYIYTDYGDFTIFNAKTLGEFDFAAEGLGESLRDIVKGEFPNCDKMEMTEILNDVVYFDADGHELTFDIYSGVIWFEDKKYEWIAIE